MINELTTSLATAIRLTTVLTQLMTSVHLSSISILIGQAKRVALCHHTLCVCFQTIDLSSLLIMFVCYQGGPHALI